ncbi:IMP cyclohydrolase-like protein [Caprobacter fermentans]|uniref:IMP cyclohydrolase n=1 Tax=Caproicibacter fermentans TaxID=2576756 RepID=A0A6N8HYI1_9FIRM|nr:IMP cyclohydrolase [Caproicibacter fermentans]MVB10655.1 IMP cyclohydrolase-like protein [Caproicibacter fermentans]OCN03267.1 inosine monophosphate cyclohydrolase [Clostridium sp. W14A]QNK40912.1 IMP cyclohydrolase [Caproicibacter fermentans]
MQRMNLAEYLGSNPYPGRGILLGNSEDGKYAVIAYFIMGRSENSRNRVFEEEGQGIRTRAFDESKLSDASLIIYSPVRVSGAFTVVTNGDQTDTVCEYLEAGKSFVEALRTRTFEPDAPNYTPRISGLVQTEGGLRFTLSILKSWDGSPDSAHRQFFEYNSPAAGEGRIIHTYSGDGDPLPSFEGEPVRVALEGGIDELTHGIWNALNEDNKISLFVRFINLKTGLTETRILNKNR